MVLVLPSQDQRKLAFSIMQGFLFILLLRIASLLPSFLRLLYRRRGGGGGGGGIPERG